jgi:hypothetical protein
MTKTYGKITTSREFVGVAQEEVNMKSIPIDQVIDNFNRLEIDEREFAFELMKKQLVEARRAVIAQRSRQALRSAKAGKTKKGTVEDLKRDLDSD